jgi:hypothetical protein
VASAGRTLVDAKQLPEITEQVGATAATYYRDRAHGQTDAFVTYRFSWPYFNPSRIRSLLVYLVDAESGVIARALVWQTSDNAEPRSMARQICHALIAGEKK